MKLTRSQLKQIIKEELNELSLPGSSASKMDKAVSELEQAAAAAAKLMKDPKATSIINKFTDSVMADPEAVKDLLRFAEKIGVTKDDSIIAATKKTLVFVKANSPGSEQNLEERELTAFGKFQSFLTFLISAAGGTAMAVGWARVLQGMATTSVVQGLLTIGLLGYGVIAAVLISFILKWVLDGIDEADPGTIYAIDEPEDESIEAGEDNYGGDYPPATYGDYRRGVQSLRAPPGGRRHRGDPWEPYITENKMKLTKSQLKQIIKEELEKVLNENRVANIERTNIEGAESSMDPMYRAGHRRSFEPEGQFFTVTLSDGTKINAHVTGSDIILYDLQDREIFDKVLEQEVLMTIRN